MIPYKTHLNQDEKRRDYSRNELFKIRRHPMADTIASLDQELGRAAKLHRLLREAGLPDEAIQWPIDDLAMRQGLVGYWRNYYSPTAEPKPKPKPILRLISDGETIVIGETDGKETIATAKEVFLAGIDSDFVHWYANEPCDPTPKTPVDVYELAQDATFEQMFDSICSNPERLCFAQSQIIRFVKKHQNWLHPHGWATFFPFKSGKNFFVAYVRAYDDGRLAAFARRREYGLVWDAERRTCVVFPQLRPFVS